MPKNKLPRKSTHIDMTAMCDVAFLLLTFFMLATKFKPDEPVVVTTPSSIAETKVPDNTIVLSIDPEGRVLFNYDNEDAKEAMLKDMNEKRKLGLSADDILTFKKGSSVGAPLDELKEYFNGREAEIKGIPVDTADYTMENNELVYWVQNARIFGKMNGGESPSIAIKADMTTNYPKIQQVLKSLTKNKMNNLQLITSAEAIPPGTPAYEAAYGGNKKK